MKARVNIISIQKDFEKTRKETIYSCKEPVSPSSFFNLMYIVYASAGLSRKWGRT